MKFTAVSDSEVQSSFYFSCFTSV